MNLPPNVTYRQFYYWVKLGLLPTIKDPGSFMTQKGNVRKNPYDIDETTYLLLYAIGKLREYGFETDLAARIAQEILDGEFGASVEIGDGVRVRIVRSEFFEDLALQL